MSTDVQERLRLSVAIDRIAMGQHDAEDIAVVRAMAGKLYPTESRTTCHFAGGCVSERLCAGRNRCAWEPTPEGEK